jgi:hypothetical protein
VEGLARAEALTLTPSLFPLISWEIIPDWQANHALVMWEHWLGACRRPFGRQSFGLFLEGQLVAVAVSCSTVNGRCAGMDRKEVVELARLCAHPDHTDMTRVALRLWRKVAPLAWSREYWPVKALVSYSNALRHTGDIYRFDGWKKWGETRGGEKTDSRTGDRVQCESKKVWTYVLIPEAA